jgi:gelsolin
MSEKFIKYHVQKGQLVRVPQDQLNEFGTGDVYLVDTGPIIYSWIGKKSTPDERFIGAITSVWKDQDRKGAAKLVTVNEGEEPTAFLNLFKGKITITEQDTEGILKRVALKQREFKLFRVHIEEDLQLFYEVDRVKASLATDDVFLLDTYNKIYIWRGRESSAFERWEAMRIAEGYDGQRAGHQEVIIVEEGEEPKEFFKLLGK